ncbi:carboxypeptidase-like regulatory domain-containing protein [Algoriphagus taiwanensis]|uniref:CarboxypepD_reg-like domain-containing protein n=1 Tax=Algoriphagus taiwanensis TaxID=1445656 RepID=A0ABQ6Q2Z8_9BACT|nr:hypothetical protein Ataiwa_16540 [Algoriphagus taiwanensis]
MKCFFLTYCICLLSFFAHGDIVLVGKVTNELDEPISFASVGFVDTSIGTVSNMEGEFILFLQETPPSNSILRVSSMGFEPVEKGLTEVDLGVPLHFQLKENTFSLDEVIVKSGALETIEYGNPDEKTAIKTNLAISNQPNMNLGAEIGRKFRLSDKPNYLSKLKFHLAYNNFDTLLIRINFYQLESGKLTQIQQAKPIIRQIVNQKSGWVTLDLEEENQVLSGTVVASIEWIGASKVGNTFALNISMPALFQTHYYKYGAQNRWKVYPNMSSSMVLSVQVES